MRWSFILSRLPSCERPCLSTHQRWHPSIRSLPSGVWEIRDDLTSCGRTHTLPLNPSGKTYEEQYGILFPVMTLIICLFFFCTIAVLFIGRGHPIPRCSPIQECVIFRLRHLMFSGQVYCRNKARTKLVLFSGSLDIQSLLLLHCDSLVSSIYFSNSTWD